MKLSRSLSRPASIALAALSTCAAFAQDQQQQGPIVITGTIVPRTLGSEVAASSVLTRADIERAGVRDLVSALNLVGTAIAEQQGGSGTNAVVRLRGADSRDTLVLIDGVPITDVTSGQASIQQIPAEIIERIEVVRGNLSALYGANATGGVIQVFTRRGDAGGLQARASLGGGSRDTQWANASVAGGSAALRGRLTVGGERTDGFSAANPAISPFANPDDDGNRRRYATLALDSTIAPGHDIGADVRVTRGDADYDNPSRFSAPTDTHHQYLLQRGASLRGQHRLADAWSLSWRAGETNEVRQDTGVDAFGPFDFGNELHNRLAAIEVNTTLLAGWTFQGGLERLEQSTDNVTYTRNERDTDVVRLAAQHDASWGSLQANVRHDRTSDFGSATTGLLGGTWRFAKHFSAIASVSNSFTPPTLDFLFFDCGAFVCSNPSLQPERSNNVDVGLQWQSGDSLVRATLFDVRYEDKIANDAFFVPANLGSAKNRGVELAARTALGPWQLAGELTVQDPVNADTGERLQRRPRSQAALRAYYEAGAYGIGGALRYVGDRPDFAPYLAPPGNRVTLPSYTVVDLSARWTITPQWSLQATAENVFDREYEPSSGYSGKPRGAFVGLTWQTP